MNFLTTNWKNLVLINYEINPDIIKKYIQVGTEFDFFNKKCLVSLVGFMFENTKVLGLKIPFHINFEEVNLRFYVKRWEKNQWKRGVVFIKEIVPKSAITWVANTLYKEHYQTLPMRHQLEIIENQIHLNYQWKVDNNWQKINIIANNNLLEIKENSEADFITEHYFGYSKVDENTTFEYEVEHPKWQQYDVTNFETQVDFEANYGKDFKFLNNQKPTSIIFAKGSKIVVKNKKLIQ